MRSRAAIAGLVGAALLAAVAVPGSGAGASGVVSEPSVDHFDESDEIDDIDEIDDVDDSVRPTVFPDVGAPQVSTPTAPGDVAEAVLVPVPIGNGGLSRPSPGVVLAGMNPLTPARLLDTRDGIGVAAPGPIGPNSSIDLLVTGRGDVPASGVDAVALNVTVTNPTASSYITVWPAGGGRPLASSLNMAPGQTVANLVFAKVGAGGAVSLYNFTGTTDLVADVVGWSGSGEFLKSLTPTRILDTREGIGAPLGPVGPGGTIDLPVTGHGEVPATGVDSVVLNVTVTEPTADSFVTVWPTGVGRPLASSLNMAPGEVNPNMVIAKVGAGGSISLYNHNGFTHLVVDIVGWLPSGGAYTAINPTRVLDTRTGHGTYGYVIPSNPFPWWYPRQQEPESRVRGGETMQLQVSLPLGLPPTVTAVMLNVTATEPTDSTYVTAWAFGSNLPLASSLNVAAGTTRPNLVMARVGPGGYVNLYNHGGLVHLVVDVVGYFEARNAQDAIDQVAGPQVHVVHVVPSDRSPSYGEPEIRHVLDVAETWLEVNGGRGFRFDAQGGTAELSTLRIAETAADIAAESHNPSGWWREWLTADGFGVGNKAYIVFVDGVDTGSLCGLGGGQWARMMTASCGASFTGALPRTSGTWTSLLSARTTVHEMLHVLGAVAPCAPNGNGQGHVNDIADVMSTTDFTGPTGELLPGYSMLVDPGRDDYWGNGGLVCGGQLWPDVAQSPWLDAP